MAPITLKARNLGTVLTANDAARSIQFYKNLGFTVTDEFKEGDKVQGAMLNAGNGGIGISQDDFSKGRDRVKGIGMSLYLETDQDIQEIARSAKAAGIKLDNEPAKLQWGPMGFRVTDPDGFKLTIAEPS